MTIARLPQIYPDWQMPAAWQLSDDAIGKKLVDLPYIRRDRCNMLLPRRRACVQTCHILNTSVH